MIHPPFLAEIRALLAQFPAIRELDAQEADAFTQRIAQRYVDDADKIWWWDSLSQPSTTIEYGEALSLEIIGRLLAADSVAMLLVTDDREPPWPLFTGTVKHLLEYLGEMWTTEYILADPDLNWLLFDTHHNELVLLGSLVDSARPPAGC